MLIEHSRLILSPHGSKQISSRTFIRVDHSLDVLTQMSNAAGVQDARKQMDTKQVASRRCEAAYFGWKS